MTKAQEFRDLSLDELEAKCEENRKALYQLTNKRQRGGTFEKPHRLRQLRKEIARILTIISEKSLQS